MEPQVALVAPRWPKRWLLNGAIIAGILLVVGVLIWQGVTSSGAPHPDDVLKAIAEENAPRVSPWSIVLNTGILVFREGLEAILVLAALTASLVRTKEGFWKPVAVGAGLSFLASVATWFVVVAIISDINAPEKYIQAVTGLLAVGVLLVIMNWFFHKIYWTGWIAQHNRWRRDLMGGSGRTSSVVFRGLLLMGFTSIYREGFEVVLFLQDMRMKALKAGYHFIVLEGVAIGLALTLIVAWLTFVAHYRLPYKKMLVLTGMMLGVVLLVMVGESVQEMQYNDGQGANWISTTPVWFLPAEWPDWLNTWFVVYNSWESLLSQLGAAVLVVGSYFLARRACWRAPMEVEGPGGEQCMVPDCGKCDLSGERGGGQAGEPGKVTELTAEKKPIS